MTLDANCVTFGHSEGGKVPRNRLHTQISDTMAFLNHRLSYTNHSSLVECNAAQIVGDKRIHRLLDVRPASLPIDQQSIVVTTDDIAREQRVRIAIHTATVETDVASYDKGVHRIEVAGNLYLRFPCVWDHEMAGQEKSPRLVATTPDLRRSTAIHFKKFAFQRRRTSSEEYLLSIPMDVLDAALKVLGLRSGDAVYLILSTDSAREGLVPRVVNHTRIWPLMAFSRLEDLRIVDLSLQDPVPRLFQSQLSAFHVPQKKRVPTQESAMQVA